MDLKDGACFPPVSLRICLQPLQRKALQDALGSISINEADCQSVIQCNGPRLAQLETDRDSIKQQRMSEVKPDMILTQSISVILFTLHNDLQISQLESSRQKFGKNPWRFHHVTEVNTTSQSTKRIHARQEYYELLSDLPLFSMGTTHCGRRIIRVNIFTYNHSEMVKFYSNLLGLCPITVREDFTYFAFHYTKDLTLQLSLKGSSKLMPYPINQAELVLSLHEVPNLPQLSQISEGLHAVADPDKNNILITIWQQAPIIHLTKENLAESVKIETCDLLLESDPVKLKALQQDDLCNDNLTVHRPDVIPAQDNFVRPLRGHSTMETKPAIRYIGSSRQRSGSPANLSQKLVIHTQEDARLKSPDDHCSSDAFNNNELHTRCKRDSVDIVATF